VNEFSELKEKKVVIEEQLDETKNHLINFAKQEDIEIVYGSNKKVSVKEVEKYSCENENKEKLESELKKKKLLKDYTQVKNTSSSLLQNLTKFC